MKTLLFNAIIAIENIAAPFSAVLPMKMEFSMLTIISSGLMYAFPKFGKCRAPPFDPLFEINSQLIVMFFTKSWNVIAPPYPAKLIVPLAVLFAYFPLNLLLLASPKKIIAPPPKFAVLFIKSLLKILLFVLP